MKVYVSEATIVGISDRPYYDEAVEVAFLSSILFDDATRVVSSWSWRKAGNSQEEADEYYDNVLLPNFRMAKIYEGSWVTVLSNEEGRVLAICSADRRNVGWWIDGKDLKVKKFSELGLKISQLVIG